MPPNQHPIAATLWMAGAIASFSAMAVAGRMVSGVHDTFEIMAWRSLVGLGIVGVWAVLAGRLAEIRGDRLGRHMVRNLCHFIGQNLWFWALAVIPLAQVIALEFTSPIWVILLSPLLLGERITAARAVSTVLGFAGILIVARPDFAQVDMGVLAAAGSAIFFAASIILTKTLTRHESVVSIMFWLTLMQAILGLACTFADGRTVWPTPVSGFWLALIGLSGLGAHLCLTQALSLASAGFVVTVDFLRLPVFVLLGMILFSEPLDALVIVGGGVILLANWISIRAAGRASRPQDAR
ncbi:DMT family transporter [Cereibacter sphaeroides]|uniref:DMT family transporter n=1 Tax=Cereibacter sphaeroides TaxID=1063 RepID=UPI001F33CB7E|nr:DMT family transporter [Cereibacter sphaeroides]MCE6952931.1 DMT family transporter [Cereibacter sphaeroides]MCE6961971.1 DMT family transporter [Cereibacter sphaeroides]MCE6970746.1 DMT family transporter [Cereibacter sphaeroides]MCE6975658.1 DMT family transporter [Cereibacter sphaeroides]